jgi:hypothetical protein
LKILIDLINKYYRVLKIVSLNNKFIRDQDSKDKEMDLKKKQ